MILGQHSRIINKQPRRSRHGFTSGGPSARSSAHLIGRSHMRATRQTWPRKGKLSGLHKRRSKQRQRGSSAQDGAHQARGSARAGWLTAQPEVRHSRRSGPDSPNGRRGAAIAGAGGPPDGRSVRRKPGPVAHQWARWLRSALWKVSVTCVSASGRRGGRGAFLSPGLVEWSRNPHRGRYRSDRAVSRGTGVPCRCLSKRASIDCSALQTPPSGLGRLPQTDNRGSTDDEEALPDRHDRA